MIFFIRQPSLFSPIFNCLNPDQYSKYGSGPTKLLKTDPVWMRVQTTLMASSPDYHILTISLPGHRLAVEGSSSEENLFWRDELTGAEHGPTAAEFRQILRSHLFHNYNITYEEGMLFKLWRLPLVRESYTAEQNRLLERLSLRTIWNLLQVKYMQHSRTGCWSGCPLKLSGTCSRYNIHNSKTGCWSGCPSEPSGTCSRYCTA